MPVADNPTGNQPQSTGDANADFLGASADLHLDDVAETSDPSTSEEVETVDEGEQATEAEETTEQETEEVEAGETTTEEWLSSLTPGERLAYAKRYPSAWNKLNDPDQPEDVKQLLRDKINTDIQYARLRAQLQQGTNPEEETEQEEGEQSAPTVSAQVTPEQRAQWLENVVTQNVDPKTVQQFGYDFLVAAGVDPKDPDNKPVLDNAGNVGKVLAKGAIDIFSTLMPQFLPGLLPQVVEQVYPKFGDMHSSSLYQAAWENVRSSNPQFASLPAYSGKGFREALERAQAEIPGFDKIQFKGNSFEQAVSYYSLLAKQMSGGRITPADVARGVEAGKQKAVVTNAKKVAARALGAGQSTQQFSQNGSDQVMDDLDAIIKENSKNLSGGF